MKLVSHANYQFWVFALGGSLLALAYGRVWPARPPTTAPYELAIELDPGYAIGQFNVGVAEHQAGHLDAALAHYRAATAADPHDHTPCLDHAQVARKLDQLDEALEAARCAAEHDDSAAAYDELGQVLLARRDPAAVPVLEEAARQAPDDADIALDLGIAYAVTSREADAERVWRRAVAIKPGLADAWFNLALAVWKRGDAAEAYTDFSAAVTADGTMTKAMGNLAVLDSDAGRVAPAIAWLDRLLAIEPTNAKAKQFRAELAAAK